MRGALVVFALLFLPMACWFAYVNFRRYWIDALSLAVIAIVFLRWALDRREESWITTIDDIRGPR